MKILKLYGERRSGTGYTTELLDQKFPEATMDRNAFGSRHDPPREWPGLEGYILLVRDPFHWLAAFHDEPFGCPELRGLSFSEFLDSPVKSFTNGRVENRSHENPVVMWNDKVADYTEFALRYPDDCVCLRYEVARDDPGGAVLYVAHHLKLAHTSPFVEIPTKVISPGNVSQRPFHQRRPVYSALQYDFIVSHLDVKLAAWWGYQVNHGW